MGRLGLAVVVACLPGCAQLFGIENTTSGDADGDGAPGNVTLRIVRMSVGATDVTEPQDLTGLTATYEIPDPTAPSGLLAVPAMQASAGTWSAPVPDGTPGVDFTMPDDPTPTRRFYALPSRAISTTLQATFPFDQPGVSVTGQPVQKITTADAVTVLRYVGNKLTGYSLGPGFDQTGNDTISGAMAPVADDQPLEMSLHPDAVADRYAKVTPAVANLSVAPTDVDPVSRMYGNPFDGNGWHTIVTWVTSESRTYAGGQLPATLYAGINQFVTPGTGLDLTLGAALPTTISIGQVPLV